MKKTFLISFLFCLSFVSISQTPNFQWAKQMGGISSICRPRSVAVDAMGYIYTTGVFLGSIDFDPGPGTFTLSSFGSFDIYISKFDASGNFVWAKQLGGISDDEGNGLVLDPLGNVYVTGIFYSTADFDPGAGTFNLTATGQSDIFISKLNSAGIFIWAKKMGGDSADASHSIALDGSGNICTTGSFKGTADFDPGASTFNLSSNKDNIFVSKLDAAGNFVWAKQMVGTFQGYGNSVATDLSGNVYTTGYFIGTTDFDPGVGNFTLTSVSGVHDIFVSKLDGAGNFIWAKQFVGTSYNNRGLGITVDASNNVYTTGIFYGIADFDPSIGVYNLLPPWGSYASFISKLDVSGNFVWAKQMAGAFGGYSIITDASGNVYTTGFFGTSVDFDPGPGNFFLTSVGFADVFISKLNFSGNFVWAKQLGGNSFNAGYSITIDIAGNIYTVGEFNGTSDFDEEAGVFYITVIGSYDAFIHKMGQTPTGLLENNLQNNIVVFPNPTNGLVNFNFYNKTINASIKLFNMTGKTLIEKTNINENKFTIDISDEASGMYFLELNQSDNIIRVKVLKN